MCIRDRVKGESEYTYPPYSDVQARELIDGLRNIAPYVVIDCGSYIANDILSAVALMESDAVLRLANADLKSISYLSSQLPLLKDAGWDLDKQYKTASNVKPQQAGDHMARALGTVAFTLPYSAEVESLYLAGDLLGEMCIRDRYSRSAALPSDLLRTAAPDGGGYGLGRSSDTAVRGRPDLCAADRP